jgi:hypothetical protein
VPGAGSGARRRLLFRLGLAFAFGVDSTEASEGPAFAVSALDRPAPPAAATLASWDGLVFAEAGAGAVPADVAGALVSRGGPDVTWADSPAGGAETRDAGTTVGVAMALAEGHGMVDRVAQLGSGSGSPGLAAPPAVIGRGEGEPTVGPAEATNEADGPVEAMGSGVVEDGVNDDPVGPAGFVDEPPGPAPGWAGTAIGGRLAPA